HDERGRRGGRARFALDPGDSGTDSAKSADADADSHGGATEAVAAAAPHVDFADVAPQEDLTQIPRGRVGPERRGAGAQPLDQFGPLIEWPLAAVQAGHAGLRGPCNHAHGSPW